MFADDNKGLKNPVVQLGLIAFVTAVGLTFLVLGCALYGNWYPMICLIPFVFALAPLLLCGMSASANDDIFFSASEESILTLMGQFLVGAFGCSGIALLFVLWHSHTIVGYAVAWCMSAFVVLAFAGGLLARNVSKKSDDF